MFFKLKLGRFESLLNKNSDQKAEKDKPINRIIIETFTNDLMHIINPEGKINSMLLQSHPTGNNIIKKLTIRQ